MDDEARREEDEKARIEGQQALERKRQDERGGTDLLRGGTDLLRGGTDLLRGGTDLLRGATDLLRGTGPQAATDIFRAAAGLGGHLIVAFVAPVSGSSANTGCQSADPISPAAKLSATAKAVLAGRPDATKESPKANTADVSNKPMPATTKD
jgi:hypothetical protein